MILSSGFMGILITLGVLLVLTTTSPVAVNITGIIKDVLLTYLGFICFKNVNASIYVISGLTVSFVGAVIYSMDSYKKLKEKQKIA